MVNETILIIPNFICHFVTIEESFSWLCNDLP